MGAECRVRLVAVHGTWGQCQLAAQRAGGPEEWEAHETWLVFTTPACAPCLRLLPWA